MVDDGRRAQLEHLAGLPEEAQDRYILDKVPPSQREQFIRDLQNAAAEDEGLLGELAARVTGIFTAGGRADRLSEQAIREASEGDIEYVQVSECPNANYRAVPHEELQRWSTDNNDPGSVGQVSSDYDGLRTEYEGMNESVSSAVGALRGAWTGDAGEAAGSYGDQLGQYTERSASNARLASEVTNAQADSSSSFRSAMPEPIPFSWESEISRAKSSGDPFEAVSIMNDAYDKQAQSQAAHDQAAQVAANFEQSTYASAGKTPVFTEPPKFSAGGESRGSSGGSSGGVGGVGGSAPSFGGGGGGSTSPSRAGGSVPNGSSTAPSFSSPGGGGSGSDSGLPPGAVRLPDGSIRMPDGTIIKPDGTKILPDGTKILPDGTRILPNGQVIPPGNTASSGLASSRDSDSGGAGAFAPIGGPAGAGGAGGGAASGFGPLGGGSGAGAGAGGALGAGKGAGAGGFGPPGSGAAAKGGMGGGMGRGGMMGGAGGGKGGGDDDKEHQDRFYVKQELDPGLQIEYDEYGEKLIDETTGNVVVPPVIGE